MIRPTDAGASHARDRSGSRAWLAPAHSQRGISLIELIMFIVIVSVALAGILLVMNATSKGSANPLIQKQALAIAESLLEEVELMPFTICDPGDVNAASAVTAADCTGGAGGANDESRLPLGPEAGETRYHPTTPFDNVSDYNGFTMNPGNGGIRDITGTLVATLGGFSATITVAQQSVGGIAAAESLLITVSATGPDGTPVVVDGVRTRYAPRTTP
ncbi:MAG TPA: type II secretion system protein [Gallionella sp.]|nr:type II secretion system protein [Gallionella sp.]